MWLAHNWVLFSFNLVWQSWSFGQRKLNEFVLVGKKNATTTKTSQRLVTLVFCFVFDVEDQTQILVHVRQALHHWVKCSVLEPLVLIPSFIDCNKIKDCKIYK